MNTALMFSKASDEWSTPQDFYDELHAEFRFNFDAAARAETSKCGLYYHGPDHQIERWRDALTHPWHDRVSFCNPPYSRCREFVAKAALERLSGATTVMLIPARTDTRWWHEHIWDRERHTTRPGVEVRFVKGRLKFGNSNNSAPFPSAVVIFRPVESGVGAPCGGRVDRVSDDGGRA